MQQTSRSISPARVTGRAFRNKETGSCFDQTKPSAERAGRHELLTDPVDPSAFRRHRATNKRRPAEFLRRREGIGGRPTTRAAQELSSSLRSTESPLPSPERAASGSPKRRPISFKARPNPPNTSFRRFYERGDLPVQVDHSTAKKQLRWKVDITKLDLHHYLPIFFDGLREQEEPFRFIAEQGVMDMLDHCGGKVLPVVPQLIIPIKTSLNTRRPSVVVRALRALQKLVVADVAAGGPAIIGQALVPYYRQILPILNIFKGMNKNLGDTIEYGQRKSNNIGDLVQRTLELLEVHGGDDAFINIKYLVPTYQSVVQ